MAWPMIAWVLDTCYPHLFDPGRIAERSIIVSGAGESQLIELMNRCMSCHPGLKVFSLPRREPVQHVEPRLQQRRIAPELVDHEAAHQRLILR